MVIEQKIECIAYYEASANSYDQDRFSCDCSRFIDQTYREGVAQLLAGQDQILDVGTGTGRFAVHLALNGKKVTALDPSQAMLSTALGKAMNNGVGGLVEVVQGDSENLPFRDSSFNGLCTIHVLVHLPDVQRSIQEFSRVVEGNGRVVMEVAKPSFAYLTNRLWRLVHKRQFFSYPDYYHSLKDVNAIFATCGFRVSGRKKVKLAPRILLHLLMCRLKPPFLGSVIRLLERLPMGGVALVQWQKTES